MKEADKIDCLQFVALYNFQQWLDHHLAVPNELKTHHGGDAEVCFSEHWIIPQGLLWTES